MVEMPSVKKSSARKNSSNTSDVLGRKVEQITQH